MPTIGFSVSAMNSTDEVNLDWVIVAFFKFYPVQLWNPETKQFEDGEDCDLVEVHRPNVREQVPEWKNQPDAANNFRIKFTDKEFGRIAWDDKAKVEAFCVDELDKLNGMRVVENDEDEIEFATGDKTKLDTYTIRESQRKV